jgi:phosphatidylglycerophosphatase A
MTISSESVKPIADVRFLVSHPAHAVALGWGSGLLPFAPGTAGTLLAWVLMWGINAVWPVAQLDWPQGLALLIIAVWGSSWACGLTAQHLGVADPGLVVIDEIVAFALVLWLILPCGFWQQLAAFVLFRFFDTVKPGPVGWADRLFKNRPDCGTTLLGFGIVLDDLIAAFLTLLCLSAWRFFA